MEYKRITERFGKGIVVKETSKNDNMSIWNAIVRLSELEDKIESGELVDISLFKDCKQIVNNTAKEIFQELYNKSNYELCHGKLYRVIENTRLEELVKRYGVKVE